MPEQDRKNIDLILLTIGLLIGIAVGLFVIARDMGNESMERMRLNDPEYQAAVDERIQPYGRVVLDGEVDDAAAEPVVQTEEVAAPLSGPQVYNQACAACHSAGIGGAPATGDVAAWAPRLAQGRAVLDQHALEGFQGPTGSVMPAKGGAVYLSDDEIIAAVDYFVEQAQ